MFAEAGLPYSTAIEKVPSSRLALAAGELARSHGVFDRLHERLFDAYWARAEDIGDPDVLVREAAAAGLTADGESAPGRGGPEQPHGESTSSTSEAELRAALRNSGDLLETVQRSTRRAHELGAGGVPAWVIDERVLVPGAQPHEVFDRVLEKLGHAPLDRAHR